MSIKEISTDQLPKNILPTAGMKIKEQYEKDLKDGKINKDGTPITPAKPTDQDPKDKKEMKDIIKEYLATKDAYNVMIDGQIVEKKRRILTPREHFMLHDITIFYNKMLAQISAIDRRRLLLTARANILGRSLNSDQNLKDYDEVIQQLETLTERIDHLTWSYDGNDFKNETDFGIYLYQKICELCLGMTEDEFSRSAFRSSPNLAATQDVYGTRHIADACLETERESYAYFQKPLESSLKS